MKNSYSFDCSSKMRSVGWRRQIAALAIQLVWRQYMSRNCCSSTPRDRKLTLESRGLTQITWPYPGYMYLVVGVIDSVSPLWKIF
eukprot:m.263200 g.263200  ORF g.263200 m.263200 type:complete len:85 (+) comp40454_c0_seq10:446-700(+)